MAEWDTSYINDLPDSSFAYIAPGGHKDAQGKTVPRENRFFPYKDAGGKVDVPHLRNALARLDQSNLGQAAKDQAKAVLTKAAKATTVGGPPGEYSGAHAGRSRVDEPMQTRTFDVSLEVRSDGDGRTLVGRAVPYGQTIGVKGGRERFVMGAFARQIASNQIGKVKLASSHTARMDGDILASIGRTVSLSERPDGLHGAWHMYDTPNGNAALHLVKTGEVTGLSIGFQAVSTKKGDDGAMEQHVAHLDHVVLTDSPAYADAQVMAVRSAGHPAAGYRTELLRARQILDRLTAPY